MRVDQLLESMNDINDDYLTEYAEASAPAVKIGRNERWAIGAAACLCVGVIGMIAFMLPHDEVKPPTPPPLQTVVTVKTESTPGTDEPTGTDGTSFVTDSASETVMITETSEPPRESETRHTETVYEPPQTQAIQTDAPQTEAPQTDAPQTDAPQTDPYTETTEDPEICYTVTAYIPDDPATDEVTTDGPGVDPIGTEDIVTDIVTEIIGGDDDPEPVLGDVDRDGKVTAKDAATLIKALAGYAIPRSFYGSDINGDFNIDSRDLALLLKSFAAWEDAHK